MRTDFCWSVLVWLTNTTLVVTLKEDRFLLARRCCPSLASFHVQLPASSFHFCTGYSIVLSLPGFMSCPTSCPASAASQLELYFREDINEDITFLAAPEALYKALSLTDWLKEELLSPSKWDTGTEYVGPLEGDTWGLVSPSSWKGLLLCPNPFPTWMNWLRKGSVQQGQIFPN